jgi:hypothetical protein
MKRSIYKIAFIIVLLLQELLLPQPVMAAAGDINTIAGNGKGYGGDAGPATSSPMNYPGGVAVDSLGNIFIADTENNRIRKVDHTTGNISTVSGNGTAGYSGDGGLASNAQINFPWGLALDAAGNLFIADSANNCIRKIDQATGNISTVSGNGIGGYSGDGGPASIALLNDPRGVTVDPSGNIFIADTENNRVRKVDHTTGNISTVSGNGTAGYSGDGGPASIALLNYPRGVTVDLSGNIFIADTYNSCVRKVDQATGIISTVAGNGRMGFSGDGGPSTSAELNLPYSVAFGPSGNLFIADFVNHRIRKVDASGTISTIAGSGPIGQWGGAGHIMYRYPTGGGFGGDGGPSTSASLYCPASVAIDLAGNLFIADSYNHRIRKVDLGAVIVTPVIASLTSPDSITYYYSAATMPSAFTGTAADGYGGTGLAANSTVFTLQRRGAGFWNGINWLSSPTWLATSHNATSGNTSAAWSSIVSLPPWVDGGYTVQVKATNKNDLINPTMPINFSYDNTPPSASINVPVNGANYNPATMPVTFNGTASDGVSGGLALSGPVFSLQRGNDGKYWSGISWMDSASWLATVYDGNLGLYTFTWASNIKFPTWISGSYNMQVRTVDHAGNTFLTSPVTFTYTLPTQGGNVVTGPVTLPSTPAPGPEPVLTPTPVSIPLPPSAVPSARKLQVNIGGQTYSVTSTGQIDVNAFASSPDRKISIFLPRGTSLMSGTNLPADLTIVPANSAPLPPVDKKIIGIPYQCLPDGTIFEPPVDLTWGYDPTKLPEGTDETSLQLVFYNEAARNWEIVPGTVDVVNHTMKAKISHFTIYAMMAQGGVVSTTPASLVPTNPDVIGSGPVNAPSPPATLPASESSTPLQQAAPINSGLLIGLIILAVLVVMAMVILVIRRRNS